jgi:molybdopterin-guanine dinucleotide biosynthesis protein A
LESLQAQRVHFESAAAFASLNTREDLAAVAARFANLGGPET